MKKITAAACDGIVMQECTDAQALLMLSFFFMPNS